MFGAEFHLQSIALTMVFVSGVAVLCLAPALLRFPDEFRPSLRSWIIGTALVTTTDTVFFTGVDLPFLDTILLVLVGLGVAEWSHALRLLNGHAQRAPWPYLVVLAGAIALALSPGYPLTAVIISVTFTVLYLGAARTAAQIRMQAPSVGRAVLIAVFAGIGLIMLGRLALFAFSSGSGAGPGFTNFPRAIMFIAAAAGPFTGSLGFLMTCGEKLGHRLLHLSLTDPLTGIPNRRAFLDSLQRALAWAARHSEPVAVLFIDIDHFKSFNDEAGHSAGDQILVEVAALLVKTSRSGDTVGRIGGEEFGVVQRGIGLEAAAAAAERLREVIAGAPITTRDQRHGLTVSIGVAVTDDGSEAARELLARADTRLYEAKHRGRNRVVTTDPNSGSVSRSEDQIA